MKFYLDEHLAPAIAVIARRLGVDISDAVQMGRLGLPDEVVLRLTAAEGRCIVTADKRDFVNLTRRFAATNQPHAGVLLVPSSLPPNRFSGLAHSIAAYVALHPDGIPPYTVDYLRAP